MVPADSGHGQPEVDLPDLTSLSELPYISDEGLLPSGLAGKVGIYAIFDAAHVLQYVGYSRDVHTSLLLHLVRCPRQCHWLKVHTVTRPSRTLLTQIQTAWLESVPGPIPDPTPWNQPIDVKTVWTASEEAEFTNPMLDDRTRQKALKQAARRLEEDILAVLKGRGVQIPLRFNPKLKEEGLLDLKF